MTIKLVCYFSYFLGEGEPLVLYVQGGQHQVHPPEVLTRFLSRCKLQREKNKSIFIEQINKAGQGELMMEYI